jgi:hypothetical protein
MTPSADVIGLSGKAAPVQLMSRRPRGIVMNQHMKAHARCGATSRSGVPPRDETMPRDR